MSNFAIVFATFLGIMPSFSLAAPEPTSGRRVVEACDLLVDDVGHFGATVEKRVRVVPTGQRFVPTVTGPVHVLRLPSYQDLGIEVTSAEIPELAALFAAGTGRPEQDLQNILSNAAAGSGVVSIRKILPDHSAARFGKPDRKTCYDVAFGVRHPQFRHRIDFMEWVRDNYAPLNGGDVLRFGDIALFWSTPPNVPRTTFHAAYYIGGDFFYHKLAPNEVVPDEFVEFSDLLGHYQIQQALGVSAGHARAAADFHVEYLHFDGVGYRHPPAAFGLLPVMPQLAPPGMTSRPRGNIPARMEVPRVGRNDPCPCNSGKKFKNCHGRPR